MNKTPAPSPLSNPRYLLTQFAPNEELKRRIDDVAGLWLVSTDHRLQRANAAVRELARRGVDYPRR